MKSVLRLVLTATALMALWASTALASADKPVVLDPVTVTALAPRADITVDVTEDHGLVSEVLVVDVRKGSTAERAGFSAGMEIVAYRGSRIIGISRNAFEKLREEPVVPEEISIIYEVKNRWGDTRPLALFIPDDVRESSPAGSEVDRLAVWARNSEQYRTNIAEVRLKRPIDLKDPSSKKKLGYDASTKLMEWQTIYGDSVYDEVRWAHPVVKDGKMVAWQLAYRRVDFGTAQQLKVDYFGLKSKTQAYPGIESDIRLSFEKSGKVKPEDIGMFSILYDEEKNALGFWVGVKIGEMVDRSDEFKDKGYRTKESLRQGEIPNSDPLAHRGNRNN